jgi:D-glycero-D-manno-heptose 1,7-bisphosphate phosphatase
MSKLHKAVFFDRDGVINRERADHVKTVEELEILPNVAESVRLLKDAGFLVVVITNQSAVNRGLMNHNNIKEIHSTIQKYLERNGTYIDGFYYCPHRPDENCDCRKPKAGLLLQAAYELKIDLKSSWMIGDKKSDLQSAKLAGCKAIIISVNMGLATAIQNILNSIHS